MRLYGPSAVLCLCVFSIVAAFGQTNNGFDPSGAFHQTVAGVVVLLGNGKGRL
jgi:hypothetical protein